MVIKGMGVVRDNVEVCMCMYTCICMCVCLCLKMYSWWEERRYDAKQWDVT